MENETVSEKTIFNDLTTIERKFGVGVLKIMMAKIISSYMWWSWPSMRSGITEELKSEGFDETTRTSN